MENANSEAESMGQLLVKDPEGTPFPKLIDPTKLNFSIESLNEVDNYLNKVRKNNITSEKIRIIVRCGTYLGEVIRKAEPKKFNWISYSEALKVAPSFIQLQEKSITNAFILYDSTKTLSFPLGKPYKFLQDGRGDSLIGFAKLCLGNVGSKKI